MTPASAPPRVHERLRSAPDGPVAVVHAGRRAVYVDVGGWCVGVVGPGAAQVPCALRVLDMGEIAENFARGPLTAYLGSGTLRIGGCALPIGRLVGAYVPSLGRHVVSRETSPVTVQATPPATVAGFVVSHVPHGRIDAAVAGRILGRGEGLTPLGDDLLAGWLAVHRAAGVPTPAVDRVLDAASSRTSLLSLTLLDCARHGEVLPEFAAWLAALGTAAEPAAVAALHAVGGSSGAGLHLGGRVALDQIREAA